MVVFSFALDANGIRRVKLRQFGKTGASDLSGRTTSNPEAEATLQRQRGLVLPNAVAFTDHNFGSHCEFVDKHWATREDLFPRRPFQRTYP